MCGRYTLYKTEDITPRFRLDHAQKFLSEDSYNVAPGQWLPVIIQKDGARKVLPMQWGFVPYWANDPRAVRRPINTRSETAFEQGYWRQALKYHRALIPSRGFYEWKHGADGSKEPYFIRPKDQELFAFAGIFSIWIDAEGHPLHTFSMMTTSANHEMADIHDRMPVILLPENEPLWVDPQSTDPRLLGELLHPYPDGHLEITRVSKEVNSPLHNSPDLIRPL